MTIYDSVQVRNVARWLIACWIVSTQLFSTMSAQNPQHPVAAFQNDPNNEPREHPIDMKHMRVEVSFEPERGLVKGRVSHVFVPLRPEIDSVFFDGPAIRVLEATLNGRPLRFKTLSAGIAVYPNPPLHWGKADSISFVYEANPRRGIYFVGWNDPKSLSRKQIWTQGQGIDNRHWIPCYDDMNDKMTTEMIVTFDGAYRVLSNGAKISERSNRDGTKTWHYRMSRPHSSYLVMLGIGKYAVETRKSKRGVPVHLWYYPELGDRVEPTYRYSAEAVDFMELETGIPYPWESYSQIPVQDFLYGAMENTTATVFGDFFLVDSRAFLDQNYIDVNVHELAHQWFGDLITGRNSKNAWLQEGFATFYPKLFGRRVFGEDHYQWTRRGEHNAALAASETDRYPIVHSKAGGARIYQKGSSVLDMMMYVFGEAEFKAVIRQYLRKHSYANVVTSDLYHAFQDTLGLTAEWFFDQWLYRGGEPHYEVMYDDVVVAATSTRQTEITVRQVHPTDELVKLFRMPLVFQVHYADGTFDAKREWVEKQTERIVISNPQKKSIAFVLFDPGSYVLKKVIFRKPLAELKEQAHRAPTMIDRYDAIVAMREFDLRSKRDALVAAYEREAYHAVRAEVVSQLVNDEDDKSANLIKRALKDPHASVRLNVASSLRNVSESVRQDFEGLLRDSSYTIVLNTLERLCRRFPDNAARYLDLTKEVAGVGNQVKIKWLEIEAGLGGKSSCESIVTYASSSYEFRTRVNALNALKRLNYVDDALLPHLFDALVHPNARLRGPATDFAGYLFQQSAYAKKLQDYYRARRWEPWQREILDRVVR